jgi:hypothetical protein
MDTGPKTEFPVSKFTNVFVSYSHADASLVAPVVKLLRVNKSLVFQDTDSIQAGKRWRSQIAEALAKSDLVVVFWCNHASQSEEVSKEWKSAIEQEKDLLPLLLDATPLPPKLTDFQWIDFRGMVGAHHSSVAPPRQSSAHTSSAFWSLIVGLAVFGIGAVLSWYYLIPMEALPPLSAPEPPGPTPAPPPAPVETDLLNFVISTLIPLGVLFAATAGLVWLFQRWRSRRAVSKAIQQHIARELGSEILRRTALMRDAGA